MRRQWERVGNVGVDSGLIWVGDPCYIMPDNADLNPGADWYEFCDKLDNTVPSQEWNAGISIQHFGGDGSYPVFIRRGRDGLVAEVKIVFDPDNEPKV